MTEQNQHRLANAEPQEDRDLTLAEPAFTYEWKEAMPAFYRVE
jgi:hypothetical protein